MTKHGYTAVHYEAVTLNGLKFRDLPITATSPVALMMPNGRAAMDEMGERPHRYASVEEAMADAEVLHETDDVPGDGASDEAKTRLNAAAPELLTELQATADWLTERAGVLRQLADHAPGVMRKRNEHLRPLRDEAARFEGRAGLIRILITKATGG